MMHTTAASRKASQGGQWQTSGTELHGKLSRCLLRHMQHASRQLLTATAGAVVIPEQASDAEPTLGERVAALQLEEQKRAAVQAGIAVEDADEDSRGAGEAEAEAPLKAIKADSLAVLLTQVRDRCLPFSAVHFSRVLYPAATLAVPATGNALLFVRCLRGIWEHSPHMALPFMCRF